MKKTLILAIKSYKHFVSPSLEALFGKACRYKVTCSDYAIHIIDKEGVFNGSLLALKRIMSCNSFTI